MFDLNRETDWIVLGRNNFSVLATLIKDDIMIQEVSQPSSPSLIALTTHSRICAGLYTWVCSPVIQCRLLQEGSKLHSFLKSSSGSLISYNFPLVNGCLPCFGDASTLEQGSLSLSLLWEFLLPSLHMLFKSNVYCAELWKCFEKNRAMM